MLPKDSSAKTSKHEDMGVKKLNEEGKPNEGNSFIMPIVIHNGAAYIAGRVLTTRPGGVMGDRSPHHEGYGQDQETGRSRGLTMDDVLQLSVFLTKIEHYDGMNNVFKTYFPHGGPARTTVAVAALPGNSLVEINCIAAVTKK